MIYFQSLTRAELAELIKPLSRDESKAERQSKYRARQIFHWVYQRHQTDWDQMTDLSLELRDWLKANLEIYRLTERLSRQALDGTHKFLWDLFDGKTIESVIIPAALQEKDEVPATETEDNKTAFWAGKPVQESVTSARWSRLTACISSQSGLRHGLQILFDGCAGLRSSSHRARDCDPNF